MLRTFLIGLFLIIFFILSLPVQGILWLLRKEHRHTADVVSLRIVQAAFKIVQFLAGVRLTVTGEENVPKNEAVLYIGNHSSYFDVVLTYSRVPRLTGYISKEAIFKVPVLGTWMKRLYCLALNRENPREGLKVILTAIDYIKEGISIFIFPEGTRSKDGTLGEFHAGSFKVATKTGCKIVPVAIKGSSALFEDHFPEVHSGKVSICYGKPIDPADLSKEELKHISPYVREKIAEMLESM